ncbi:phospholipase D-like domain-containing protein [Siccirubricoccus phaeus]|uniref:phospholipase D-like domain-containing protein n=1 Tax=Siccirubricoccus phaeus TaxID=2595053 RepID=UPI0011F233FF|nr:phospholipase D-like domain-containing protein [Siccirubricoccus phaeus]
MRATRTTGGLRVHAVAGTYVVMLGMSLPRADCGGLLGFSIHRIDHKAGTARYLEGMKTFAETDPGFPAGAAYPTDRHPIQSFQWADYSALPGRRYTYTVTALKGTPRNLLRHAATEIFITTESPEGGTHDVYFNRGVAASQEYVRRFGNRAPEQVANDQAFIWLSRGLYEAMVGFVESAVPGRHALRIAAYEFHYRPFLQVVKAAIDRGVDVRIIYDARKAQPRDDNRKAVREIGLRAACTERQANPSAIAHNKFIVKLESGRPVAVWTGGTNFSEGGIFGHSNVAHLVEEPAVAARFLDYWNALEADPPSRELRPAIEAMTPLPALPLPAGTSVIFSPRPNLDALAWYADLARQGREGLLMTFAFGMHDVFKEVYRTAQAPFRLALLERKTRPMGKDDPKRAAEEQAIQQLRNMPENTFAIGALIATNQIDGWVKERLSGLNSNVRYVHNKFMLVDPLSSHPVVVAGSANFSDASTDENDENMIVVAGNTRVADIYLGEFMRLYSHHAFRESLQWRRPEAPPKPLSTEGWWQDYFGDTERSVRRRFFARLPATA